MTASGKLDSEAIGEWRKDWKVPVVAMIGTGASTIHFSTLGIFIKPIMADTGWSLSVITSAALIFSLVGLIGTPLIGRLLDRIGAGKVATIGLLVYFASLAAIGLAHSPTQWWILWTVLAALAMLTRGPVWVLPIAKRFDRSRGMALALMGCGLGLFSILMPTLTLTMISSVGWRLAYPALAAIVFLISWPVVWLVFGRKNFDAVNDSRATARTPAHDLAGPTWQQAVRSRYLWQLSGAAIMVGAGILGMQLHLAPMFQEKAMAPKTVAMVIGTLGVSTLVGRFLTGYLLDKFSGRVIGAGAFLLPVVACLLYLRFDGSVFSAIAIVVLFGFTAGAETDVLAFVTARYLGLRSFGTCFGIIFALQALGGGAGPLAMSQLRSFYGDYDQATRLLIFFLTFGSILLISLGKPPVYEPHAKTGDMDEQDGLLDRPAPAR